MNLADIATNLMLSKAKPIPPIKSETESVFEYFNIEKLKKVENQVDTCRSILHQVQNKTEQMQKFIADYEVLSIQQRQTIKEFEARVQKERKEKETKVEEKEKRVEKVQKEVQTLNIQVEEEKLMTAKLRHDKDLLEIKMNRLIVRDWLLLIWIWRICIKA